MKTFLFGLSIGVVILIVVYYLSGSWKFSLAIAGIGLAYLAWVIRFELGISDSKSKKEDVEKMFDTMKKDHNKSTKDNPTLR